MSNIYFLDEEDKPVICTMKPECFFYKGKSLGEIKDFEKSKTIAETSIFEDHDNNNEFWLNEKLKGLKESVESKMGGSKKNSSDMKKDRKENKNGEKNSYDKTQVVKIEDDSDTTVYEQESVEVTGTSEDSMFRVLNSLRKRGKQ